MIDTKKNRTCERNQIVTFAQPIRDIFFVKRNQIVTFAQPNRDIHFGKCHGFVA